MPGTGDCGTSLNDACGSWPHDRPGLVRQPDARRGTASAHSVPQRRVHRGPRQGRGNREVPIMAISWRRGLGSRVVLVAGVALVLAACGGSASMNLSTVGAAIGDEAAPAPSAAAASAAPAEQPAAGGGTDTGRATGTRRPRPATTSRSCTRGRSSSSSTTSRPRSPRRKTAVLATGGYIGASAGGQRRRPVGRHDHLPHPGVTLGGRDRRLRGLATEGGGRADAGDRGRRPDRRPRGPASGTCAPARRRSRRSPRGRARSATCSRSRPSSPTSAARSSSSTGSALSSRTRSPTGRS